MKKNSILKKYTVIGLVLCSVFCFACSCVDVVPGTIRESAEGDSRTQILETSKREDLTTEENKNPSGEDFISPTPQNGTDIFHKGFGDNENYVVVIDAGHQDHGMNEKEPNAPGSSIMKTQLTSGTQGIVTRIPEYELTLAISLLLRDELLKSGYTVVMVRETNDVNISNIGRALIANKYKPSDENNYKECINVRIHANGFDSPNMRGALMYCCTSANPYEVGKYYDESVMLANLILDNYCNFTSMPKYKNPILYGDDMTGTNWSEVPTTIIELGFMSNEEDDRMMAEDKYRKNAAKGMKAGIDLYFTRDK